MLERAEVADLSCSRAMGRVPAGPPSRRSPPFSGASQSSTPSLVPAQSQPAYASAVEPQASPSATQNSTPCSKRERQHDEEDERRRDHPEDRPRQRRHLTRVARVAIEPDRSEDRRQRQRDQDRSEHRRAAGELARDGDHESGEQRLEEEVHGRSLVRRAGGRLGCCAGVVPSGSNVKRARPATVPPESPLPAALEVTHRVRGGRTPRGAPT